MNRICMIKGHTWQKVYPDEELIAIIEFERPIEEIWECTRCGKAKRVMGTVGKARY